MKRKIRSLLLTACLLVGLVPTVALAETGDVNYRYCDENGANWQNGTKKNGEYALVEKENTIWGTSGQTTWYVVQGDVTISTAETFQPITVTGDVHLILVDGCDLIVNGGIKVKGSDSLTIYGQDNGTGKLTVQNVRAGYAGIGGGAGDAGGNITINGGTVEATGGHDGNDRGGAGIGGGRYCSGGTITINGGTVEATGGNGVQAGGAGIGGGGGSFNIASNGGNIIIRGGMVIANGGSGGVGIGGAGIGGGTYGSGGNITISSGTVTANGGDSGAGIGGGSCSGHGGDITISGGTVEETGGYDGNDRGGAGIGGGIYGSGGNITISGGTVEATGGYDGTYGAGIGGGTYGSNGTFSTTDSGHAVVFASSIADQGNTDGWSGVIFQGDNGSVYGNQTLIENLTFRSEMVLTVPYGTTLINKGTLTNSGKIYVEGTFDGTADNLYYPLTLENASATDNTSVYNNKTYGKVGSEITLTPDTHPNGYLLDKWEISPINAVNISENNTFTMPKMALTVSARWKDITVPVISGIEDGKTYCSAQTVTVSDNDAIATVTVNGTEFTLDEHKQFTLPANGRQTIVATDNAGNKAEMTVTVNNGHTYSEWQSNGDGTHTRKCTIHGCNGSEDGDCAGGTATCVAKAICDTCKTEYGELDSTNHDLENTPAKAATDTATGNKEYWHCKDCGKYFADEKGTNEIKLDDTIIAVNAWGQTVLRLQATAFQTSVKLKWNAVPEADGYVIYWNKCGSKKAFKQVKEIKSGKTLTWTHKKLKKSSWNRYIVRAYKVINGKKSFIKTSNQIHLVTKGGKYTNVKKLKSSVSKVTLKKGKTKTLKITQTYAEKNKKLVAHMRPLTYTTSDKKVATVTKKGVIKAKGKGSCYIYITAYSGVYTRVKVTVK